jgi:hypothetical protein
MKLALPWSCGLHSLRAEVNFLSLESHINNTFLQNLEAEPILCCADGNGEMILFITLFFIKE